MLPLRLQFSSGAIADLNQRLEATRWPALPVLDGWEAGAGDLALRDLVRAWRYDFDWFAVERRLNSYAHLRGPVDTSGVELHCVVLARGGSGRLPLLLLHGWPGSFLELLPAAERLAAGIDGGPGFDVIIPSLPGFGLSDAARGAGMHPGRIAELMHSLMHTLGYTRYGVQGGDWGAHIGARLARLYPEAVMALHLNFAHSADLLPPAGEPSPEEQAWRNALARVRDREGAYSRLQRTKPHTLGYALNDSPVGLLAWIAEKFHGWSDRNGHEGDRDDGLSAAIPTEALLANVTLYWLTGTALSSARTYYEAEREGFRATAAPAAPVAFTRYPAEFLWAPREVIERSFNLVRYREQPRGGHFAALEQPDLFATDVAEFFAGYRPNTT